MFVFDYTEYTKTIEPPEQLGKISFYRKMLNTKVVVLCILYLTFFSKMESLQVIQVVPYFLYSLYDSSVTTLTRLTLLLRQA